MKTSNEAKNLRIKETQRVNKARRASLVKRVFELKVDESHLSNKTAERIKLAFLEAKWLLNTTLSEESSFTRDYKHRSVTVMLFNHETGKCDISERRELTVLSAQIIQALLKRQQQNIINLAKAKRKGVKIGGIRFVKEVINLPLAQFDSTHKFIGDNYVRVQKIGKMRVSGMRQLDGLEIASASLVKKASGLFLKILTYSPQEAIIREGEIGLDFGVKDCISLSDGRKFSWNFNTPKELRRKQHNLARKKRGSRRYAKQKARVKKSYERLSRRKDDAANKFVRGLGGYALVALQDESIRGWQAGLFGKAVQHSILGRIKSKVSALQTAVVISRWLPTTKFSPVSLRNIGIGLHEREFVDGAYRECRDVKSAKTVLCFARYRAKLTREELMSLPVEEVASIFANYPFDESKPLPVKREAATF